VTDHGLSERHIGIIRNILAPYADRIERVDLFGSRATGAYRPDSDIDMVLRGQLDESTLRRIWTLLNDSALPFKVDVNAYDLIAYSPFKAHIDAMAAPFLTQADLQAALRESSPD